MDEIAGLSREPAVSAGAPDVGSVSGTGSTWRQNPAATGQAARLPGRRVCRFCIHYRMRPNMMLFSAADLSAPGVLKARCEWDQQQTQRAFQEEQRLLNRQPFDYEPHHYPWCARFTKQELVEKARTGNEEAIRQLVEEGGASLNPVTGAITPLYILCAWINEHEDCEDFTARKEA
jgi:hypothetical protein